MPTGLEHFRLIIAGIVCAGLAGCSSVSSSTAENLDSRDRRYYSRACQDKLNDSVYHEQAKWIRNILSPVITVITGGAALPFVVGANANFEYLDRIHANDMSGTCGGTVKTQEEIHQEVLNTSLLSIVTGTVSPSSLIGQTAQTTGK